MRGSGEEVRCGVFVHGYHHRLVCFLKGLSRDYGTLTGRGEVVVVVVPFLPAGLF